MVNCSVYLSLQSIAKTVFPVILFILLIILFSVNNNFINQYTSINSDDNNLNKSLQLKNISDRLLTLENSLVNLQNGQRRLNTKVKMNKKIMTIFINESISTKAVRGRNGRLFPLESGEVCNYPVVTLMSHSYCRSGYGLYQSLVRASIREGYTTCLTLVFQDEKLKDKPHDVYNWKPVPNPYTDEPYCAMLEEETKQNNSIEMEWYAIPPFKTPDWFIYRGTNWA